MFCSYGNEFCILYFYFVNKVCVIKLMLYFMCFFILSGEYLIVFVMYCLREDVILNLFSIL